MKRLAIAIACAALCGGACAGITATSAIPRDGGAPGKATMKRHAKKVASARKGGGRLVFIGDSITHFWESKGAKVLKRNFSKGDRKMFNLGTSGDRTENVIWRLENGELDGYDAKCVHVMIGTNNTGHRKFSEEPPSDTILGIRRILQIVREKQPRARVVLSAIFPRGEKATDSKRVRNDVVNAEISKLCDGKTVLWCDFRDKFLAEDGTLPAETVPGFLHPNGKGYQIWADNVRPFIEYGLTGKGTPPASPAAKDPRPGCEADPHPRAARPTTRLGSLDGDSAWADKLLADRNRIVEEKSFDTVYLGDEPLSALVRDRVRVQELSAARVLDLGFEGDRTENVLWRAMYGELEGLKAGCFVVSAGAANGDDAPEDVAAGVGRILDTIAQKHPKAKVVLLSVSMKRGGKNAMKVNALLRKLAHEKSAKWVVVR